MVIKSKNKKRKLSENVEVEEDVPVKVVKNVKSVDDDSSNEMEVDEMYERNVPADSDEGEGDKQDQEEPEDGEERDIQFKRSFNIKYFREQLREKNSILDIRHFIQAATKDSKHVAKYINKGGKPLELVEALERIDKTIPNNVSYIFNAIQLVLIEILTNSQTHTQAAIQACRYLLNSHKSSVEKLLRSDLNSHKKSVLKLLTAIVALEPTLGREILTAFDVLSDSSSLDGFTSHSRDELMSKRETVRTCFIHFILAYLIEGNITLIRNILEKNKLIMSIISGLVFDSHDLVVLVLNSLNKFVLKSLLISKTQKVQTFNASIVIQLLKLYEWKGPQGFTAGPKIDYKPNAEQKKYVENSVHDLLVLLLSSRKYGLAFASLINMKSKNNMIQKNIIQSVALPWEDEKKSDLIVKIIKACPELMRFVLKKVSPVNFNLQCIQFVINLIKELSPDFIKYAIEKMDTKETGTILIDMCMPSEVLRFLNEKKLKSEDYKMRFHAIDLLYTMFDQMNNFLTKIEEWDAFKPYELRRIKFDVINHVLVNCPSVEVILSAFYVTMQQEDKEEEEVLAQLDKTLDLLLIIAKFVPTFIEKTSSIINYIQILKPVYELREKGNNKIELKAIKLILQLEPQALSPDTDLFTTVVESFVNIFVLGSDEEKLITRDLLRGIFKNTGLFENGVLEIDLWLEGFNTVDEDNLSEVIKFLIDVIKRIKENPEVGEKFITRTKDTSSGNTNVQELFYNIENGIALKGVMDVPTLGGIFPAALNSLPKKGGKPLEYLQNISFYLFHYLPSPEILYNVCEKKSLKIEKYMKSWIKSNKVHELEGFGDLFDNFSKSILQKESEELTIKDETKTMIEIYMINFYVAQLARFGLFDEEFNKICLTQTVKLLEQLDDKNLAIKYIYCNQYNILQHFQFFDDKNNITNYIYEMTKFCKTLNLENFDEISVHYRNKIVNQITSSVARSDFKKSDLNQKLLEVFDLSDLNCVEIVESLIKLDYSDFVQGDNENILNYCLKRLAVLKGTGLESGVVSKIGEFYINSVKDVGSELVYEKIEESIYLYLIEFSHNIGDLPEETLEVIFSSTKITKSTSKLAALIYDRNPKLNEIFMKLLKPNLSKKELIYPLLNIFFGKKGLELDSKLLPQIYSEYKNGIIKSIEKPQKAGVIYKENIISSMKLIELCMPINECTDFCKKSLKIDSVEVFQCQLIKTIHLKAMKNPDGQNVAFVSFIKNWIQLFITHQKKEVMDFNKIKSLIKILSDWMKMKDSLKELDFEEIYSSPNWTTFCRMCLKYGMQSESEDTQGVLLKIMGFMCNTFYPDNSNSEEAATFFEMAFSHSEFFEIIFNQTVNPIKTNLFYLLFTLANKSPSVVRSKHISIFLGAYQAKLSNSDRYILALLQFYEKNEISLYEFRPFIWGETAITHYSLRDESTKISSIKEPSMMQVMSLINRSTIESTLSNYPIWRKIDTLSQLPEVNFDELCCDIPGEDRPLYLASNKVEKFIETKQSIKTNQALLKICPRKDDSYNDVYDPAFFVPLMGLLFAPEVFALTAQPAQNGILGVIWSSLSSLDVNMRLAAGHVLLRYRNHLEGNRNFSDKQLWMHLYDSVQNGLGVLSNGIKRHKNKPQDFVPIPRVPYVSGLFLAKTSNILSFSLNKMYGPLSNYLLVKTSHDFLTVPEFNVLFHSQEIEHLVYRQFILEIIRDGLKCNGDFNIVFSSMIFKPLMGFFGSPFATRDANLMILSVVNTAVKIPKSAKTLVTILGILPWLSGIIDNLEMFHFGSVDGVINIISNLWYSIKINEKEYKNVKEIQMKLLHMQLKLIPLISTKISINSFSRFVNILLKVSDKNYKFVTEKCLLALINSVRFLLADYHSSFSYIKANGGKYIEDRADYVRTLRSKNLDENLIFSVVSMRDFVLNWIKSNVK